MLRRSISSTLAVPMPTAIARSRIGMNNSSRCSWVSCLESCTPLMNVSGEKTTAAATTGPAIGPTPGRDQAALFDQSIRSETPIDGSGADHRDDDYQDAECERHEAKQRRIVS